MNVKWVNSSSVLSWMYWSMSPSSWLRASWYGPLPLPPGTSLSWIPPSSLYCCHRSVSRISAAAKNLRIAASPFVSLPLLSSSWSKPGTLPASSPEALTVAAPAAAIPFLKNARRFAGPLIAFSDFCIASLLFAGDLVDLPRVGQTPQGESLGYSQNADVMGLSGTCQEFLTRRCEANLF